MGPATEHESLVIKTRSTDLHTSVFLDRAASEASNGYGATGTCKPWLVTH